jgi:hypothetical protein
MKPWRLPQGDLILGLKPGPRSPYSVDLESLKRHLQQDGIALTGMAPPLREVERSGTQTERIEKLIDEARDAIRQYDYPRGKLLFGPYRSRPRLATELSLALNWR